MTDPKTVRCEDVELDNGENLKALGEGNFLELDRTVAGMSPGTWQLLAYQGDSRDGARMRKLSRDEIHARRRADAISRIYE